MKKLIQTNEAPKALGPYSQAVTSRGYIFTSGQLGIDPVNGEFVSQDIREQTRQALNNISSLIKAADSNISHIVKTTIYLKDINDFAAMNEVYSDFFKEEPLARSAIQAARLPKDGLIEIEAIAEILHEK